MNRTQAVSQRQEQVKQIRDKYLTEQLMLERVANKRRLMKARRMLEKGEES